MRTHVDAFIEADDPPEGYVQASGAPVLRLGQRASLYLSSLPDPAAWLRALSAACDDLAEQVDLAAAEAMADRDMAAMRADAGIGA